MKTDVYLRHKREREVYLRHKREREVDALIKYWLDPMMKYTGSLCKITKIIFNGHATIVFFGDGQKEVVKCDNMELYDTEKAILYAFMKHVTRMLCKPDFDNNLRMIETNCLYQEQNRTNENKEN